MVVVVLVVVVGGGGAAVVVVVVVVVVKGRVKQVVVHRPRECVKVSAHGRSDSAA